MKTLLITISLMFICGSALGSIELTQQEFDNIGILHDEVKKHDTNFIGFSGSKAKMKVIGVSEEDAQGVIDGLDLDALIIEKEEAAQEAEDTKEEEKLLRILDREGVKTKIKNIVK